MDPLLVFVLLPHSSTMRSSSWFSSGGSYYCHSQEKQFEEDEDEDDARCSFVCCNGGVIVSEFCYFHESQFVKIESRVISSPSVRPSVSSTVCHPPLVAPNMRWRRVSVTHHPASTHGTEEFWSRLSRIIRLYHCLQSWDFSRDEKASHQNLIMFCCQQSLSLSLSLS